MEKPTKVEAGQRWGYSDNPDDSFTVTNAPWAEHPDMSCFTWNGGGEGAWETAEIPTKYKFLGYAPGYGPQQGAGPEAPTPAPEVGKPTGWRPPHTPGSLCGCSECEPAPEVAPRPCVEMRADRPATSRFTVGNLTALEAIRSRKPPAPWVPSVDDWDLLPDAGR